MVSSAPKILYVAGTGRSGSTLLGNALGHSTDSANLKRLGNAESVVHAGQAEPPEVIPIPVITLLELLVILECRV